MSLDSTGITTPMIRNFVPKLLAQDIQPMTGWYTGEFNRKYWPYQHRFEREALFFDYNQIDQWCWANFKGRYWRSEGRRYAFKREKDYMLFLLRWA